MVSLYFGGKSHVSSGQNVSFEEPCENGCLAFGSSANQKGYPLFVVWKENRSHFGGPGLGVETLFLDHHVRIWTKVESMLDQTRSFWQKREGHGHDLSICPARKPMGLCRTVGIKTGGDSSCGMSWRFRESIKPSTACCLLRSLKLQSESSSWLVSFVRPFKTTHKRGPFLRMTCGFPVHTNGKSPQIGNSKLVFEQHGNSLAQSFWVGTH